MKSAFKVYFAFLVFTVSTQATWHPYVGLGIGLSKSQNTFKANFSNVIGSDSKTLNMDGTGPSESLILGIRNQQKNFFLAGEIFTTYHQINVKRKENAFYLTVIGFPYLLLGKLDFEVQQKYTNGAGIQIGKDITNSLDVFFKFDVFWSKFTIKYVNSDTPSFHGQENKWLFGYAPGVGIQFKLAQNLAARFDYSYRIYNEFRSKNISQETAVANTVITGKILPRVHQFSLSLIYKF